MYTNYNSNLEKNQMMTPPIIGLTSSIVNDKLNNIKLEDNSTGLFKIEDSKIKPLVEMPIETNNFIISGTDEDIDSNENNAVNKRYLLNKCVGKDDQTVTFYNINTKRINFLNNNGNLVINTTSFSYPDGDSRIYFPAISLNNIFYILNDRTFTDKPISLYTNTGIEFNTNSNGEIIDSTFQKTSLKNLVTSEMTTELRKQLILNNLMDNVCPTYRFCENNYAKTDDINFVYETLDTKVNNDYLTTNYYTKTEVDTTFTNYYTKTEIDAKFSSFNSKDLLSLITDNERYIPFSSNEILLYEVELSSSSSTNPFYTGNTMAFYFIYFYFTTTQSTSTLMEKIRKFTIKFDDGVFTYSGWIGTGTNGIKVRFNYVSSGQYIPTKFALYFEPKTIDSSFTNRFTTVQASVDRKKA